MPIDLRRDDRPIALGAAFGFALALGIGTVTIPLVALDSGYDAAAIGFLAATPALAQLATRLTLPWFLGRFTDRLLISVSALLMLGVFVLLFLSTALPVFIAAQVAQGAARAFFWTSSQTHAIRSGGSQVRRLVDLNLAGTAGTLTGPALAGVLASIGLPVALVGAAIPAALAALVAPFMASYPPYDRRQSAGAFGLIRRSGVDVACWANFVSGVWWAMIGSYVPVILVRAGLAPVVIGWLVTLSESAGAVALLAIRRASPARIGPLVRIGAFAQMAALASLALAPQALPAYGVLLVAGGMAAGTVTTLAPALITLASADQEHGDAIALAGTFRAFALLGAPASVGALLAIAALPVALFGVAAAAALPGLVLGRARRVPPGPPTARSSLGAPS